MKREDDGDLPIMLGVCKTLLGLVLIASCFAVQCAEAEEVLNQRPVLQDVMKALPAVRQAPKETHELSTGLMHSTFQIVGPTPPVLCGLSNVTTGTGFVLSDPVHAVGVAGADNRFILVTAAHVFQGIFGDHAFLRFRFEENGQWRLKDISITIRDKNNNPLWVETADVAAISLLENVDPGYKQIIQATMGVVPTHLLLDDERLADIEIHPGDHLMCLGYPLGAAANSAGFPVVRGGTIASYPLLPTKTYNSWWFDFQVFPGNSGGPVYIAESSRATSKGLQWTQTMGIVGLLSAERIAQGQPLRLGVVVPASYIIETIAKLPPVIHQTQH